MHNRIVQRSLLFVVAATSLFSVAALGVAEAKKTPAFAVSVKLNQTQRQLVKTAFADVVSASKGKKPIHRLWRSSIARKLSVKVLPLTRGSRMDIVFESKWIFKYFIATYARGQGGWKLSKVTAHQLSEWLPFGDCCSLYLSFQGWVFLDVADGTLLLTDAVKPGQTLTNFQPAMPSQSGPSKPACHPFEWRIMGPYKRAVTVYTRKVCRRGNELTVSAETSSEEKGPRADVPLPR